jgi:hypothetical protein
MTTADTEAMTALQDLLDERQRYEGWLAALEQRRGSTPPHVYERVSTDYSLRLERVMQRLGERAEQLRSTADGMRTRLAGLQARETERSDERAEWELRAAVGELSADDWEKRRSEADRELEAIAHERESLEAELAEIQRIVGLTDGAPASSPAAAEAAKAPAPAEDAASPSITDFVADRGEPREAAAVATASAGPQGDGTPEVPEVDAGAPGEPEPEPATEAEPVVAGAGGNPFAKLDKMALGARPTEQEAPALESRRDVDKTLRCPECGAMNYATEWYCERCGGELSTF